MISRRELKKAPSWPGIYFFEGKNGKILYIGKAQNLKLRLLSYADFKNQSSAKKKMLKDAVKIKWRELDSDTDALIEEAIAIKRHHPPYNVVFRDDKQYFFVGFSKGKFSKIFITHQKNNKADFIGPFTQGGPLKTALNSLKKAFPYCACREKHKRPCIRSEMGRCLGICCLVPEKHEEFFSDVKEREKTYKKNIRAIKSILAGKKRDVLRKLKKEMNESSSRRDFEKAQALRNQIFSLENIFKHKAIIRRELNPERLKALGLVKEMLHLPDIPVKIEGYDISNLQGKNAVGSLIVFKEGEPDKSSYRLFKIRWKKTPDDTAMIQEVLLRRLRHEEWPLPDLILIDGGEGQLNASKEVLKLYGLDIPLVSLAKREEELWTGPQKKFELKKLSPIVLHLFQHIRNEAHRFAINFHKDRRSKALFVDKEKGI